MIFLDEDDTVDEELRFIAMLTKIVEVMMKVTNRREMLL